MRNIVCVVNVYILQNNIVLRTRKVEAYDGTLNIRILINILDVYFSQIISTIQRTKVVVVVRHLSHHSLPFQKVGRPL